MHLNEEILACPASHQLLERISDTELITLDRQYSYKCLNGIWCFIAPERTKHFSQFITEYETVRKAEKRGEARQEYYQALPFEDISCSRPDDWQIRAASFNALIKHAIEPMEQTKSPLTILDMGAGNGWLSNRLAKRGHPVGAIDLLVNDWDGLGCYKHYEVEFTPMQAEFDHLPLRDRQIDLIIYNASLHYSEDYNNTLAEGLRCLQHKGKIVVMDTPIYHDRESGRQMVQEREEYFQRDYGFPSNAIHSENYLTYHHIEELREKLGIEWRRVTPNYGLRWKLRPSKARLLNRREPAKFELLIGHKM